MRDDSLALVTPPASEPVSLLAAKHQANVVADDDDPLLEAYIQAARELVERDTCRSFITRTLRYRGLAFPCEDWLALPSPPLQSVTSIKYYDSDNVLQTLDAAEYSVDTDREPGVVWLTYGSSWPDTYERHDAIEITYNAGYGDDEDDVPMRARQAIQLIVAHWYRNREAVTVGVTKEIEIAYRALTNSLRVLTYP